MYDMLLLEGKLVTFANMSHFKKILKAKLAVIRGSHFNCLDLSFLLCQRNDFAVSEMQETSKSSRPTHT